MRLDSIFEGVKMERGWWRVMADMLHPEDLLMDAWCFRGERQRFTAVTRNGWTTSHDGVVYGEVCR